MNKPPGMTYSRNAIYTVYKGEEHLVTGTQRECAEKLGVKPEYIHWLVTPTGKKRQASRKNPNEVMNADVIDWEVVE